MFVLFCLESYLKKKQPYENSPKHNGYFVIMSVACMTFSAETVCNLSCVKSCAGADTARQLICPPSHLYGYNSTDCVKV